MGLRSSLARILSHWEYFNSGIWRNQAEEYQFKVLKDLVNKARNTQFGKDHDFSSIQSIKDFQKRVPIREYEEFRSYIDKIKSGERNVLWPGTPLYFSTTSGTTSGMKYIPISRESIKNQTNGARMALLFYIHATGKANFLEGKMIFLSGSPKLQIQNGIPEGRLSGIVNHHIPSYLKTHQLPSFETNCIEDWETKVDSILEETLKEDLRLISGIPPWVQMYFDRIYQKTGKSITEVFPNFDLFVYGGVNFEPYKNQLENIMGRAVSSIETYPASEGFFAFQDVQGEPGLLLLVNGGIFYEFIPLQDLGNENFRRLSLSEVELNENYAMIISTNAGLWGYLLGDTVKFISKNPFKILVTGRIKHFISAFGEHVIGEEVEGSIYEVSLKHKVNLVEFTVAPQVNPSSGELPYHEWFIEFGTIPEDLKSFAKDLDKTMQEKNHYYSDLIEGNILQPLIIRPVKENAFIQFMKNRGKLGGQNKVPHLSNDRMIVTELEKYM